MDNTTYPMNHQPNQRIFTTYRENFHEVVKTL